MVHLNGEWLPDPYRDDLSLVVDTRDGLVVICGCCHAGLLNTLAHIERTFHKEITAVTGGTHQVSATSESLRHTVDALKDQDNGQKLKLYLNHCTGQGAFITLANEFADQMQPYPAGSVLIFE